MDEHIKSLGTPERDGALVSAPEGQLPGDATQAQRSVGESAPPVGWRAPLASLAYKDFRFLWFGMLALAAGVEMELVAIGYLVYDLTGSALRLGIVEAAFAVPTLLFALFGGVLADRMDKRVIIQVSQSLEVIVGFAVAVMILTGTITWTYLLIMALIEGSLFSFMMPARQAIVPRLVPSNQLTNAISLNTAAFSAMTLLSPVLAGGIYALAGPGAVFLTLASLKVLSVVLTTFVRRVPPIQEGPRVSVISEIKEGLNYVRHTPIVLLVLALGLLSFFLSWPFHTLIPVFIKDIYGLGPGAMGLMLGFLGAGALVGSMFVATAGRWHRGLVMIGGGIVTSVGLFLVAGIPIYYAAAAIMLLVGLGEGMTWTLSSTLIMEKSADRFRGRVSSISMLTFGLMPLGVLPAGYAAEVLGGQITVALLAGLLLVGSLVFLVTQKQIRQMQ